MPGGLTILRDGRNVFQSSLSRDNLPSLRPGFLATDRVVYTFYEPIFNQRMTDEDVEEKLVGGMANKDDFPNSKAHFEEIMMTMLTAIAERFLAHQEEEIKWGGYFTNPTISISERFGALCIKKGGVFAALAKEEKENRRHRDMLQHYVFRRAKRGQGPDIYLCLADEEEVNDSATNMID